jgi:pectinesterase
MMKLMAFGLVFTAYAWGQYPFVTTCAVLNAPTKVDAAVDEWDTERIQSALNLCNPGQAVYLKRYGPNSDFHSAPLILPRGVTLLLGQGVTLYASNNPKDYELPGGNSKPLLFSYQAAFSIVTGGGTIDGQGVAPELISSYESQSFYIAGIALRNAARVHAAIYKTPSFSVADLKIDAPANSMASGILLSNVANGTVGRVWIRVPGEALQLKASILGPTSNVSVNDVHVFGGRGISIGDDAFGSVRNIKFDGVYVDGARSAIGFNLKGTQGGEANMIHATNVCLQNMTAPQVAAPAGRDIVIGPVKEDCHNPAFDSAQQSSWGVGWPAPQSVANAGVIQKAVDALPPSGGDVTLQPGTYREVVTIRKPHVHLHGADADPSKTVIVYNNTAGNSGGTFNSATVFVEADDVTIDHLSIVNDAGAGKGQAVALQVTGDRAIFRNVRILGAQDTLFAASRYCYGDYGPCVAARQYFADCYIEGNTDFIFGDSMAVFERCELHGIDTGSVMYTAQSRHTAEQTDSGYVFDHCHLTGNGRSNGSISLGRSWRPYATVVFLNTRIDAPVIPAGWTEWVRFGKPTLPTAFYAEYDSTGPGADATDRERYSHQLTAAEAEKWSPRRFLAGKDGWNPIR